MVESQLRSSVLWVQLLYPGLRPLRGHCPGLTLGLAATRLPGALRLFFCVGLDVGQNRRSAPFFCGGDLMCGGVAATQLCLVGAAFIPRAATATRPLPGANIGTCRYAAAWRSAPFLLRGTRCGAESPLCAFSFAGGFDVGFEGFIRLI